MRGYIAHASDYLCWFCVDRSPRKLNFFIYLFKYIPASIMRWIAKKITFTSVLRGFDHENCAYT